MKLLLILLILLNFYNIVKCDYQYGYCKLVPLVSNQVKEFIGEIKIHKDQNQDELKFDFNIATKGLNDGKYGVKITRYGYPATNLGQIFNGDLNDIKIKNQQFNQTIKCSNSKLEGDNSIIGRAIAFYDSPYSSSGSSIISTCIIGIGNVKSLPIDEKYNGTNLAKPSSTENAKAIILFESTTNSNSSISGFATFENDGNGGVEIFASINGLDSSTPHGFHIHANGDLSLKDGTSIGDHYSKPGQNHSLPSGLETSSNRHLGDLGNICSFNSDFTTAYYSFNTNYFGSVNNIFGRSMAIHKVRDQGNMANMGGVRIAQGMIAMVNPNQSFNHFKPSKTLFNYDNICLNGTFNGFNK